MGRMAPFGCVFRPMNPVLPGRSASPLCRGRNHQSNNGVSAKSRSGTALATTEWHARFQRLRDFAGRDLRYLLAIPAMVRPSLHHAQLTVLHAEACLLGRARTRSWFRKRADGIARSGDRPRWRQLRRRCGLVAPPSVLARSPHPRPQPADRVWRVPALAPRQSALR